MGRPREHSAETGRRILESAGALLAEEGIAAVSVRRVADRADTTTRAIYSLFGSREGLLKQLYHDFAATMTRYHEDVPQKRRPVDEILLLADAYRRAALEHPHSYSLFLNGATGFVADGDDLRVAQRSLSRVVTAFERWADEGRLGNRKPQLVALEMWALVHGLASLEVTGRLGPPTEATQRWRDAVTNAFCGFVEGARESR